MRRCQGLAPGHGFRFRNKLYSLDASTVDLCRSMYPWAKFKQTKGTVKLHAGIDHDGYLPSFMCMTDGKASGMEAARSLKLPVGNIVAEDRGYADLLCFD